MEREPHFLDAHVEQLKQSGEYVSDDALHKFWYNAPGDCVVFLTANEGVVADRVDEYLTLYRSAVDSRAIGFQLKGIKGIMQEFDYDMAQAMTEIENDEISAVTLNFAFLMSYERKPMTMSRRKGYAEAMTSFPNLLSPAS